MAWTWREEVGCWREGSGDGVGGEWVGAVGERVGVGVLKGGWVGDCCRLRRISVSFWRRRRDEIEENQERRELDERSILVAVHSAGGAATTAGRAGVEVEASVGGGRSNRTSFFCENMVVWWKGRGQTPTRGFQVANATPVGFSSFLLERAIFATEENDKKEV